MSSKKTTSRTSVFDRLGSPTATTTQRTVTQEPPFRAGAGRGVRHRPYSDNRKKSGKFSAASSTNQRWRVPGGGLADFAPHWLSLLGNCRATGIVEDGVGSAFQQRHQLTHQCVSFRTRNSRQDLQQALDVLLLKGAKERVTNMTSLGYYNRLFLVPKKTGDLRSVILSQPPHDSATLQDGDARVRLFSHQKWAISIDIRDAYLHVPMHQAVRRYLRFVVNKQVYQFTGLPFGFLDESSPSCCGPSSAASCEATRLLRRPSDNHQCAPVSRLDHQIQEVKPRSKSGLFQSIGLQFNTRQFTVAPLPKMRCKVQSVHQHWITDPNITARDLHWLFGMLVFMASLVRRRRLRLCLVQWWVATAWCQRTGSWSDQIQVPQWVLSEVAWWASPAVLQGLPLAAKETEVTVFMDASSSGWGAQLGSRSTRGQSASQRSWHITLWRCRPSSTQWETPCLIRGPGRFAWCATTQWLWLTSRTRGAWDRTLWCSWPYDCWSGATSRWLRWFPSICQECTTSRRIPCPESARHWPRSGRWPWSVYDPCLPSGASRRWTLATFANRRLIKFVSPYPDPRAEWTDAMSMPWDNGRGLLYAFPPFKMVPQVLQKIAQPPRIRMILITQLQPAASWFPELMYLSQEDPIPLYIEGQDLLTQDVWTGDGVTETPHFRPSNLHTWKLYGPSWVRRVIPGKLLTWCQGAFWNFHSKCTNPIGQDSWRSVGRNDGTCFESEVIITAPTWCTSSETDFSHQR